MRPMSGEPIGSIGACPLLGIGWSSQATIARRGRHANRGRSVQNAAEHGRIHGISPRGCRACGEGAVGNASTAARGVDVLGAAPWPNPCAAGPAGSPRHGCFDEAVRGEPCPGAESAATGLMRARSSRASVTTGSDIAACCMASYTAAVDSAKSCMRSAMAHLFSGSDFRGALGADQLGPDEVPVVWAEVTAGDSAARLPLNGRAILGGNRTHPGLPLLDHWGADAQLPGKFGLAAERLAGFFDGMVCIHARTLALLQLLFKQC